MMETKTDTTFEEFKVRWLGMCQEIRTQCFDSNDCNRIMSTFRLQLNIYCFLDKSISVYKREELFSEVMLALTIANSKYKTQRKSFWEKIKLKLTLQENHIG